MVTALWAVAIAGACFVLFSGDLPDPASEAGRDHLDGTWIEVLDGFAALAQPMTFLSMIIGFVIGVFFAAVPGLTSALAIALLLPLTYSLDVVVALVMCASIFMAGMYAGSITAITINIPGAPAEYDDQHRGLPADEKWPGRQGAGSCRPGSMVGESSARCS